MLGEDGPIVQVSVVGPSPPLLDAVIEPSLSAVIVPVIPVMFCVVVVVVVASWWSWS